MKLNIYSIYDSATSAYHRPLFMQADQQAIRLFTDIATDAEHEIGKHPEDYTLFRIGIFDDQNAKITYEAPECISTALLCVSSSREIKRDNLELPLKTGNGQ